MAKDRAQTDERPFSFLPLNEREMKPRQRGLTEIRGPYYSVVGTRYLQDLLELAGAYVDIFKFGGGSFMVLPQQVLRQLIELCHAHDVLVSTGGFTERVLTQGPGAVRKYLQECKALGFDIVEVSSGLITLPLEDMARLVEDVQRAGLVAKPEVSVQYGAGGGEATAIRELEVEGLRDPGWLVVQARRLLEAGAKMIMIESEGITENVAQWRTDIPALLIGALGTDRLMFEAADPPVFSWYIKNYGPEVNLFVDHSQIVQLECLRSGVWGSKSLWGRVVTYKAEHD